MQAFTLRGAAMNRRIWMLIVVATVAITYLYALPRAGHADPQIGSTSRVSLSATGGQGDAGSGGNRSLSVTADGHLVAFDSYADNLVDGDTNGLLDVFVRDRRTGETERVSVSSDGAQASGICMDPSMSSDGRYVAFLSTASNLVPGDTNNTWDVFVRDRMARTTERVSVSSDGEQGYGSNYFARISADGRYVVFASASTNLVAGDTNGQTDIFVYDRERHTTERVNISATGAQANAASFEAAISADGSIVAFSSYANNLVEGDINNRQDIFVYDRTAGTLEQITRGGNGDSRSPSVNADGKLIAFASAASNLVTGDTNLYTDIFVYDRALKKAERVNLTSAGLQTNQHSSGPSISLDGRYVAFISSARNMTVCDEDWYPDVFIRDRELNETKCVSISSDGQNANNSCNIVSISASGQYTAFDSLASNLVSDDTNNTWDVFVHDSIVDTMPPSTTATLTGTQGDNGWLVSDAHITLEAVDNQEGSGVAGTEYSFDGETWSAYTGMITISTEGTTTVQYRSVDNAGNVEEPKELSVRIDKTAPQITMVAPCEGVEYLLNQHVTASWSCADEMSGIAEEAGTVLPEELLDASSEGAHSFSVRAVDNAGNVAEQVVTYYVRYDYLSDVRFTEDCKTSCLKLGRTLPIKFQLRDVNGTPVCDATARLYVSKVEDGVVSGEMPAESTAQSANGNCFTYYEPDERYIFHLATSGLSEGTWQLRIELDDGSSKYLTISLR